MSHPPQPAEFAFPTSRNPPPYRYDNPTGTVSYPQTHQHQQFQQHPMMNPRNGYTSSLQQLQQLPVNAAYQIALMQRQQQHVALQALHIQQRQQQMIHILYRSGLDRHQRQPLSRRILDVVTILPKLDQLDFPPLTEPPAHLEILKRQLRPNFQYMLHQVTAIKFESRRATSQELSTGEYTKNAIFFLDTLHRARANLEPYKNHDKFMVLRCRCCLNHAQYVRGSTNFVNMDALKPDTFNRVLQDRMTHLMVCPCTTDEDKSRLMGEMNSTEQKIFSVYIQQWSQAILAAHFPMLLPEACKPQNGMHNQLAIQSEPISRFDDLSDVMARASRIVRSPSIVFDKMADEMGREPSPLMEVFSMLYHLRVEVCVETNRHKVNLQCSTCGKDACLPLPGLGSQEPLSLDLGKALGQFMVAHTGVCHSASPPVKRVFLKRARPLVDDAMWQDFCQWWQSYLAKYFRSCRQAPLPKLRQSDYFRPITLGDRTKQPYSNLPLYCLTNPDPPYVQKLHVTCEKFIIVDNDLYRDLEGNRWFRGHISKYRSMFSQASGSPGINVDGNPVESQQDMVARKALESIGASGYTFFEVCRAGGGTVVEAPESLQQEMVMNALQNGFPEMLRPPMEPYAKDKVYDLEYAPMVGLLHGDVYWRWQECRSDKTMTDRSMILDKAEVEGARPLWGKKRHPRPEDVIRGIIRHRNEANKKSVSEISSTAPDRTSPTAQEVSASIDAANEVATTIPSVSKSTARNGSGHAAVAYATSAPKTSNHSTVNTSMSTTTSLPSIQVPADVTTAGIIVKIPAVSRVPKAPEPPSSLGNTKPMEQHAVQMTGTTNDFPLVLDESIDDVSADGVDRSGLKRLHANGTTKPAKRPRQGLVLNDEDLISSDPTFGAVALARSTADRDKGDEDDCLVLGEHV